MRSDGGAVPIELAASVGLLLLPIFVLVMTIAPVVERRTVAGRAAAEAARAVVVSDTLESGIEAARSIVEQANTGRPYALSLTVEGTLERGSAVTAAVTVGMPLVILPGVVELQIATHTAVHREVVDRFRSVP